MQALAAAGAGFLLAVLWFDLMFDVQLVGHKSDVPEPVLASISAYYKRVTTDARPMGRLVAVVMVATAAAIVAEIISRRGPHWAPWVSLVLVIGAVTLAGGRTVPRAVRLGARRDPFAGQVHLARSILGDHLVCLTTMAALLVVQLAWAR
jgi:hypothetical protein